MTTYYYSVPESVKNLYGWFRNGTCPLNRLSKSGVIYAAGALLGNEAAYHIAASVRNKEQGKRLVRSYWGDYDEWQESLGYKHAVNSYFLDDEIFKKWLETASDKEVEEQIYQIKTIICRLCKGKATMKNLINITFFKAALQTLETRGVV